MTYTLSERLKDTLDVVGIKSKGYVFTQSTDKTKHFSASTIRGHWDKLIIDDNDNKRYDIVLHQLRSCVVHYLKNKHNVSNELAGFVVGHTQSGTVTERYGVYGYEKLNDTLNLMLDEIFNDEYSNKEATNDKLEQLKILFPDKSIEQLEMFLEA